MKNRHFIVVVAAIVACAPLASAADDAHARAAERFAAGEKAYAKKDYVAAAEAFEDAAALEPHPAALLDAAESWTLAGDAVHAAQDCDRVSEMKSIEARFREEAERRLAELAPKIATLELVGAKGTTAQIDGGASVELPQRRRLAPGAHVVLALDADGSAHRVDVTLAAGDARVIDLRPAPMANPPEKPALNAATTNDRAHRVSAASWIAFGIAAAATVGAVTFGVVTLGDKSRFDAEPTVAHRDAFVRDRALTDVAAGVAVVGAIVGVVLWRTGSESSSSTSVAVGAGTVVATWSF